EPQPPSRSRGKEANQFLRAVLLAFDERLEPRLVRVERAAVVAVGTLQLTRQHVCLGKSRTGALAAEQRNAARRIADQHDPPVRPPLHLDLADDVEVQVVNLVQPSQDRRTLPAGVAKLPSQLIFWRCI